MKLKKKSEVIKAGKKDREKADMETNDDEKKKAKPLPPVPIKTLYRFATRKEQLLIVFSLICAMAAGACVPIMMTMYKDITNALVNQDMNPKEIIQDLLDQLNTTIAEIRSGNRTFTDEEKQIIEDTMEYAESLTELDFFPHAKRFGIGCIIIGTVQFILCYIYVSCLNHTAETQAFRIRNLFLRSVLRQNIGWYDTNQTGDFASRVAEDLAKLQEGLGEKIGMFVMFVTIFWSCLISAFVNGWELTLVTLSIVPVLGITGGFLGKVFITMTAKELKAYGKAGAIAEEVLSAIRTVYAFGGQKKEVKRYDKNLVFARDAGRARGIFGGAGAGVMWLTIFSGFGLAFWYGTKLIMESRPPGCDPEDCGVYDPGVMLLVFLSVMMGAINIGMAFPHIETFAAGRSSASLIYSIIDRESPIDSLSDSGKKPTRVQGHIVFKDVVFNYPARPDVPVLQGMNLEINQGETVALVGSSGCGKSTTIQLMQRFYDVFDGQVILDDINLTDLNVGWLRENIGVVGQEPVLFATSIKENIRQGQPSCSMEDIEKAAKAANAHAFIARLPNGYDTLVGERGAQLSGGQKQRIAIARALVRDPKILLLDEATSALDNRSEALVQEALDKAREGRTTIIVAHRLSTIRNADRICAFDQGKIVESGTHEELMERRGLYFSLATSQFAKVDNDSEEDDDDDKEFSRIKQKKLQKSMSVVSKQSNNSLAVSRISSVSGRTQKKITSNDTRGAEVKNVKMMRIMKMNKKEWKLIIVGCIGAVIMGVSMPVYSILFGEILGTLSYSDSDYALKEARKYAIIFVGWGAFVGAAEFFKIWMFSMAGDRLTMRVRSFLFESMLKQEIGWFDDEDNNVGALCSRLAGDAATLQGATGSRIGTILQSVTTLVLGMGLSLYYEWRVGLVMSAFVPGIVGSFYMQHKIMLGQSVSSDDSVEEASQVAVEAISNVRTVASLHREDFFYQKYVDIMTPSHVSVLRKVHLRGMIFGFSQCIMFFAFGVCMLYGGYLVDQNVTEYDDLFKVAQAMIVGTSMVGQAAAFAPNYNKAVAAAARIFKLLDREPLISIEEEGKTLSNCEGVAALNDVEFRYPSRPDVRVLKKLNLVVEPGQNVALVGSSGCGKSTVIQLLQRFYDPDKGELTLDDEEFTELELNWLRNQFGIVSQEPVLFDLSISQNISYGDNTRDVPQEEIIAAAKKANIHNFIVNLPLGYETQVGSRGTQLSGGQKQRIAIARALVRNPKILLLDEATSALDTESEKVVNEALDEAREGRTCVIIAHRLSTIQGADKIVVVKAGKVVESGTHTELLAMKGAYFQLYAVNK